MSVQRFIEVHCVVEVSVKRLLIFNYVTNKNSMYFRVQWVCEGCGKRQPIRAGSFFFRLQCSILQAMQIILAWCEDADLEVAAEHFGKITFLVIILIILCNFDG